MIHFLQYLAASSSSCSRSFATIHGAVQISEAGGLANLVAQNRGGEIVALCSNIDDATCLRVLRFNMRIRGESQMPSTFGVNFGCWKLMLLPLRRLWCSKKFVESWKISNISLINWLNVHCFLQAWSCLSEFQSAYHLGKQEAAAAYNLLTETNVEISLRLMQLAESLERNKISWHQNQTVLNFDWLNLV